MELAMDAERGKPGSRINPRPLGPRPLQPLNRPIQQAYSTKESTELYGILAELDTGFRGSGLLFPVWLGWSDPFLLLIDQLCKPPMGM